MGIKGCNRAECENVMCDRYSSKYGYICNECFNELCSKGFADIQGFMNTPKELDDEIDYTVIYEQVFERT